MTSRLDHGDVSPSVVRRQVGANRVRAHRLARELTQAQLATAVGVSRQTVNALEAGDYAPSVFLALRIGRVLVAPVEDLFEIEDVEDIEEES